MDSSRYEKIKIDGLEVMIELQEGGSAESNADKKSCRGWELGK